MTYKIPEEIAALLENAKWFRCEQEMIALLKVGTTIEQLQAVLDAENETMRQRHEGGE